jgi:hypothetical protein
LPCIVSANFIHSFPSFILISTNMQQFSLALQSSQHRFKFEDAKPQLHSDHLRHRKGPNWQPTSSIKLLQRALDHQPSFEAGSWPATIP